MAKTSETPSQEPSLYEKKPAKRDFVSGRNQPRLTPDQAYRQGRVVTSALRAFLSPTAAMAFLNGDQAGLGRPLDLAIESAGGLAQVEAALARHRPPG